jgi:Uma2 family endonuclease
MVTATSKPLRPANKFTKPTRLFGPDSAGTSMTPYEFDHADFVEGHRYELINGVLVVSPIPLEKEADPNEYLGFLLRLHKHNEPARSTLDVTLPERIIKTRKNRRRVDRAIWCGLGRRPRRGERPKIVAEFVSAGKRNRTRDYEDKRDEYMSIDIEEYWLFDRFERILTIFFKQGKRIKKRVIREGETYATPLLPGFELALSDILAQADKWEETDPEDVEL